MLGFIVCSLELKFESLLGYGTMEAQVPAEFPQLMLLIVILCIRQKYQINYFLYDRSVSIR